ncbi:MAG: serine/threonine protein phosphatase, partial [Gordonia amarae]
PEPSRPGTQSHTTPAPAGKTTAPSTGTPSPGLPEGTTAASASVPEQRDDNGNKVCRGTV